MVRRPGRIVLIVPNYPITGDQFVFNQFSGNYLALQLQRFWGSLCSPFLMHFGIFWNGNDPLLHPHPQCGSNTPIPLDLLQKFIKNGKQIHRKQGGTMKWSNSISPRHIQLMKSADTKKLCQQQLPQSL